MKVKNISTKVLGVQTKDGVKAVLPDEFIEVEEGNNSVALLKQMKLVSISAGKKEEPKIEEVMPEPEEPAEEEAPKKKGRKAKTGE